MNKSSLLASWQNSPYKTHITSQNTEYTKTQQTLRKNYFSEFSVFLSSIINYLKDFSKNVILPPWYDQWKTLGFKPVFRCSKPHTFSTFSGKEKEKMSNHYFNKATKELNKTTGMWKNTKSKRDEKEKSLSTESHLPVKFITDPWQGALVIKKKWLTFEP